MKNMNLSKEQLIEKINALQSQLALRFNADANDKEHTGILKQEITEIREKYQGLANATFEAIFISENGVCFAGNQATVELFGCKDEKEFIAQKPASLSPGKQPDESYSNTKAKILLAKNGKESVEICTSNPDIDLVMMDIQLPEMNGYYATRLIKKHRENLPVIAQTAYALAGEREKSLEAGCDDYIAKPINRNDLLLILQNYLS